MVAIFKINSIDFRFFVFMCRASRICSCSLSISCAIIVVFSISVDSVLFLNPSATQFLSNSVFTHSCYVIKKNFQNSF